MEEHIQNKLESCEIDPASKIVSSVIHEYDVINEPEDTTTATEQGDGGQFNTEDTHEGSLDIIKEQHGEISNRNRLSSSDRSNTIIYENVIKPPAVNCPEKIVFCIDASNEMDKQTFRSRSGGKSSPRQLLKKALNIFLNSKNRLDKRHEFAVIMLRETAVLVRDFTSNIKSLLVSLEDMVEMPDCDSCDISSLFDSLLENVELPQVEGDVTVIPPPYTVRLIFLYSRANTPLHFTSQESFKQLNASPYFYLDALYLHEPPNEDNKCQSVFDTICDLDIKGTAFILDASRNPTKVYDHMAMLLAHPLQRPAQSDTSYRIGSSIPLPEQHG